MAHSLTISTPTLDEVLAIRHQVLWPDRTKDFCVVDGDDQAKHYGVMLENKLVSVASIYIDEDVARLRKLATLQEFQNRGIGSFLIKSILDDLSNEPIKVFWCDARESAIEFYKRFGMVVDGKPFFKQEVSYVKMSMYIVFFVIPVFIGQPGRLQRVSYDLE